VCVLKSKPQPFGDQTSFDNEYNKNGLFFKTDHNKLLNVRILENKKIEE